MPDFVAGEIVTANKMNQIPKGVLGYARRTSNITNLSGGPVDLTDLSVQVTVPVGRVLRVVGFVWAWTGRPGRGSRFHHTRRQHPLHTNALSAGHCQPRRRRRRRALIRPSAGTHLQTQFPTDHRNGQLGGRSRVGPGLTSSSKT